MERLHNSWVFPRFRSRHTEHPNSHHHRPVQVRHLDPIPQIQFKLGFPADELKSEFFRELRNVQPLVQVQYLYFSGAARTGFCSE